MLKHHPSDIILSNISSNHCVFASIETPTKSLDFCVCLTCRKGFLGDVMTSHGSRWFNKHATNEECRASHKSALTAFKAVKDTIDEGPTDHTAAPISGVKLPAVSAAPATGTGYVYCFVNESMPGLAKIGMTTRTPQERLEEANASDTWKPPTPYTIAFAKCVSDPKAKERTIHKLLDKYSEKIHKRREFFRIAVDDARLFFDLMDGTYWSTEG
jgi:hypothetical protein